MTIRIIYCGVEGEGPSVTKAKQNAAGKVEHCLKEGFAPAIISHPVYPNHVGFVYRSGIEDWSYHIKSGPLNQVVTSHECSHSFPTRRATIDACRRHLAQYVLHPADLLAQSGCEFLEGEPDMLREHLRYCAWQHSYRLLSLQGKSENECHDGASSDCSQIPELVRAMGMGKSLPSGAQLSAVLSTP
jgi:hypothetical protein